MKIAALNETSGVEKRVSLTPEMVKKFSALGAEVAIQPAAGLASGIADEAYTSAGAKLQADAASGADVLLTVGQPEAAVLGTLNRGAHVVGMLSPYQFKAHAGSYAQQGLNAYALELLPRISRAQSMDVLSSQSNLAGYRAVIEAVAALRKATPMLMTAAGTVVPAKALVLGAGVAGLQAIATAKRLGCVVSASDVRPAVKEQVESLGAKFIEVPTKGAETAGGYAKEMDDDYKAKQAVLIAETVAKQDVVITTALIPGKPAPVLVTEDMVKTMKQGAVIVDMAAGFGGNCPLTEPDKTVTKHGVTIIGATNLASAVANDASALYAKNLFTFVSTLLLAKDGTLAPQWDDELIKGTLLIKDGVAVHAL